MGGCYEVTAVSGKTYVPAIRTILQEPVSRWPSAEATAIAKGSMRLDWARENAL
jgi:hypothetical protein